MEETGAMARDGFYIYYSSAVTVGKLIVNSILEVFL
jgi:hypothetical protein